MSDEIDDGGPAFPVKHLDSELHYPGMSLRAYLASQALSVAYDMADSVEDIAKAACSIADAVIKELNK